jgi:hypothetical protein
MAAVFCKDMIDHVSAGATRDDWRTRLIHTSACLTGKSTSRQAWSATSPGPHHDYCRDGGKSAHVQTDPKLPGGSPSRTAWGPDWLDKTQSQGCRAWPRCRHSLGRNAVRDWQGVVHGSHEAPPQRKPKNTLDIPGRRLWRLLGSAMLLYSAHCQAGARINAPY